MDRFVFLDFLKLRLSQAKRFPVKLLPPLKYLQALAQSQNSLIIMNSKLSLILDFHRSYLLAKHVYLLILSPYLGLPRL